jgi:hypothetical protein
MVLDGLLEGFWDRPVATGPNMVADMLRNGKHDDGVDHARVGQFEYLKSIKFEAFA